MTAIPYVQYHTDGSWKACKRSDPWFNTMLAALPIDECINESYLGRMALAPPGFVFRCGIGIDPPSHEWAHKYPNCWQLEGLCLLGHYVTSLSICKEIDESLSLFITKSINPC